MTFHNPKSLVIELPTTSPEELHEQLMRALLKSIEWGCCNPCKEKTDAEHVKVLLTLAQKLLPTSKEIEKGYAY